MKERPILFSAPMVRAILEGRKTQTRRVVRPLIAGGWEIDELGFKGAGPQTGHIMNRHPRQGVYGVFVRREIHHGSNKYQHDVIRRPYGQPGDRLWVRETWATVDLGYAPEGSDCAIEVAYKTNPADHRIMRYLNWDDAEKYTGAKFHSEWRPSIHMPRWASRILLEVVSVRVERVQDISEADAIAEGCDDRSSEAAKSVGWCERPQRAFHRLWKQINGPESWDANPWVWVVEFRRVTP